MSEIGIAKINEFMIPQGFEPRTHQSEGRCHKEKMIIEESESVTKCNQLKIHGNFDEFSTKIYLII